MREKRAVVYKEIPCNVCGFILKRPISLKIACCSRCQEQKRRFWTLQNAQRIRENQRKWTQNHPRVPRGMRRWGDYRLTIDGCVWDRKGNLVLVVDAMDEREDLLGYNSKRFDAWVFNFLMKELNQDGKITTQV